MKESSLSDSGCRLRDDRDRRQRRIIRMIIPTYRDKNKDLKKVVADRVNNGTKKSYDELKENTYRRPSGII